jgi:hypothetical protein
LISSRSEARRAEVVAAIEEAASVMDRAYPNRPQTVPEPEAALVSCSVGDWSGANFVPPQLRSDACLLLIYATSFKRP